MIPFNASRSLPLLLLVVSGTAWSLEPTCETYLRAAEKSAAQAARHSITETDGLRMEVIVAGGRSYTRVGGPWNTVKTDLLAAERKLTAQIRAGTYPLTGCRKVGGEIIDGIPTTVYAYTLKVNGLSSGETRASIGSDGLVYAQRTSDAHTRHRYHGVVAPSR
jgi:hypothetical protein